MSQEQPRRYQDPINCRDVLVVHGDVAGDSVAPRGAAMMQTAPENAMMGQTPKGGAVSTMQSAAAGDAKAGLRGHDDMSDAAGDRTTRNDLPDGSGAMTLSVGRQVVGRHDQRAPLQSMTPPGTFEQSGRDFSGITIGEALEATALTAGQKPVEWSDAAAIQAAEVRATSRTTVTPRGVAASAQSAATFNARLTNNEEKTKLADILMDATSKLSADKPATRKDAEGVTSAEMRNDPFLTTHPAGVAASVAAAARLNQQNKNTNSNK